MRDFNQIPSNYRLFRPVKPQKLFATYAYYRKKDPVYKRNATCKEVADKCFRMRAECADMVSERIADLIKDNKVSAITICGTQSASRYATRLSRICHKFLRDGEIECEFRLTPFEEPIPCKSLVDLPGWVDKVNRVLRSDEPGSYIIDMNLLADVMCYDEYVDWRFALGARREK